MATEIRVPTLGESVSEATIGKWFKTAGEAIAADEPVVELETDKVTIEVPAPAAGTLSEITVKEGETVGVGALLGMIDAGSGAPAKKTEDTKPVAPAEPAKASAAPASAGKTEMPPAPAAAKAAAEANISTDSIAGSGKRGQVLKGDVLDAIAKGVSAPAAAPSAPAAARAPSSDADAVREERVRMTKLRQTIARRLKDAQ